MSTPPALVTPELASLDQPLGDDSATIVRALADLLHAADRVSDVEVFADAVMAREGLGSTVLPVGIAMPHARSAAVATPAVAVARLPEPVTFAAGAEPVRIVILIAAAGNDPEGYLALLQKVAAACVRTGFVADLLGARTPEGLADLVAEALSRR